MRKEMAYLQIEWEGYNMHLNLKLTFRLLAILCVLLPANAMASSCSLYVMCADLEAFHDDTIEKINDFLDEMADNYENFLENTLWMDGILMSLPAMQEQLSMSESKTSEILSTLQDYEVTDDAKRGTEVQMTKRVLEHQPSEAVCKQATLMGGILSAKKRSHEGLFHSTRVMQHLATGSSREIMDRRQFTQAQKSQTFCQYADRDGANGAMAALCGPTQPSEANRQRAFLGNFNSKNSLDSTDQEALEHGTQSMFLMNRPLSVDPASVTDPQFKIAFMDHRSVLSREMLGSHCFLKTYETKLGGSPETVPYLTSLLSNMGMSADHINDYLGTDPSLYTQRKILTMAVNDPEYGKELMEDKNNIQRQANIVKSYQIATLFENIELMHCNQMMASQMFLDELLPYGVDLQERINSQMIAQGPKDGSIKTAKQEVVVDGYRGL